MFGWFRKKESKVADPQTVDIEGKRFPCPKKGCEFVAESGRVLGGHMMRKDHRKR